jgi:RNA polymerase sigma-70 factor, ECF subfamily
MTEAGFRSIYEQYRAPLFRFGYRLTGSAEAAEDIVHDSFVGLMRGGFDERKSSLKTYLYAAVRNLARKRHRDLGREDGMDDVDAAAPARIVETIMTREMSDAVRQAVEALPLLQREAVVLFEYEELSLEEIGLIVEADIGAVKSRLYRARENLRKCLAPAMKGASR